MNRIIELALGVFLGILLVIILIWIIGIIVTYLFQSKFFSKEKEDQKRKDIDNYLKKVNKTI